MLEVSIPATNVSTLLSAGFTVIELLRSKDDGLNFLPITSASPTHAELVSAEAGYYRIGGKSLSISVDGAPPVNIPFPMLPQFEGGVEIRNADELDLYSRPQVAGAINAQIPGLATLVGETVVLRSLTAGPNGSLLITYCDAHALGFSAGDTAYGNAAHVALVPETLLYVFTDVNGFGKDQYKWRFTAGGMNPKTELKGPVSGSIPPAAGVSTSVAKAAFVGIDGRPRKTKIIVVVDSVQSLFGLAAGCELPLVVDSDEYGYLEVPLVQGARVRVAIEGTAFVREFVVPSTPTFDLLQAMASAPDTFTIQVPMPFLIRRSL